MRLVWTGLERLGRNRTAVRKRWQAFVEAFVSELPKAESPEAAMLATGKRLGWVNSYGSAPAREKSILKRAKYLLDHHEIAGALRDYFDVAADFTAVDAANKLVDWIEGRVEYDTQTVTREGAVIEHKAKMPPSLEALKAYMAVAIPKPAKQVNIDQRTLVAKVLITDKPPVMRARILEVEDAKLPPAQDR
jgi:hypothetical protein